MRNYLDWTGRYELAQARLGDAGATPLKAEVDGERSVMLATQ